jgi:hypothetical protein
MKGAITTARVGQRKTVHDVALCWHVGHTRKGGREKKSKVLGRYSPLADSNLATKEFDEDRKQKRIRKKMWMSLPRDERKSNENERVAQIRTTLRGVRRGGGGKKTAFYFVYPHFFSPLSPPKEGHSLSNLLLQVSA